MQREFFNFWGNFVSCPWMELIGSPEDLTVVDYEFPSVLDCEFLRCSLLCLQEVVKWRSLYSHFPVLPRYLTSLYITILVPGLMALTKAKVQQNGRLLNNLMLRYFMSNKRTAASPLKIQSCVALALLLRIVLLVSMTWFHLLFHPQSQTCKLTKSRIVGEEIV